MKFCYIVLPIVVALCAESGYTSRKIEQRRAAMQAMREVIDSADVFAIGVRMDRWIQECKFIHKLDRDNVDPSMVPRDIRDLMDKRSCLLLKFGLLDLPFFEGTIVKLIYEQLCKRSSFF